MWYNGVLAVPEGTTIVGFENDLAVSVTSKQPEETVRAVSPG